MHSKFLNHKILTLISCSAALTLGAAFARAAGEHSHGHDSAPADKAKAKAGPDTQWLAKAKAEYPLTTCVVSGDKLGGDMGEAIDFVHKEDGKPDRLVRFCCKDCIGDFKKEPAKYLKMIDEAAAAKAKGSSGHSGHSGHNH